LFSWIYDVPLLLAIVLFGAGFVLILPFIRKLLPPEPGLNVTLTMYLQYFGIIYGLLLGLLAVGAYQNHAETRRAVVAEAASLAALYRDISEYPEPYRTDLRSLVREYTRFTIEDVWPKQRQGIMPELGGPNPVAGIYKRMAQFEPGTEGPDAIHQTALKQFNSFIEARREGLLGHASCHVVHGGARRLGQHDLPVAVRPQSEHPSPAWRLGLVFHGDHDLPDRDSRHALPGRNRSFARGVATGLPTDEG
jgi:hypothetical protein